MIEYAELIPTVGFPIAMTMYLLLRFEKILGNNTRAINELHIAMIKLRRNK